jgi:hypothetical protein
MLPLVASLCLLGLPVDPAHPPSAPAAPEAGPWRLDEALGTPGWLTLSGHQRTRFESLHNQFRAGLTGNDDLWSLRTALRADARFDPFDATLEILDARAYGADDETPLNTTIVNALEILQLYAGWTWNDVFDEGDELHLIAGRHTMDIGTRRLVARNAFRNTINAFTGLNATLDNEGGSSFRAFFTMPTIRRPSDFNSLADNQIQIDDETTDQLFWGLYGSTDDLFGDTAGELYYFGLAEGDGGGYETRNRNLSTVGGRLWTAPEPGGIDWEVEVAYQFGETRSSTSPADTTDLDVAAHFEHGEIGYTFDEAWKPRLIAQVDYASGDDEPGDDDFERFDTLFGARRFDFGPTGILGAFARSNVFTPGLRLEMKPTDRLGVMLADRFYYLASDQDAWTTAGVVDPAGESGDYVGNMAEIQVRYEVVPRSFQLEVGYAYLFQGEFAEDAPSANGEGDVSYAYVSTTFTF